MATSRYPHGFANGVNLRGVPVHQSHPGKVFWVSNNTTLDQGERSGSNGNKGTVDSPFATIDYAVGQCRANKGDIIKVKPGHVETVTAAGGLDLDVAGITIEFLGNDNDRARINFTTVVGADMDVDAADITLINPRFTAGIDALTGPIDVNAARFTIVNGLWEDGTAINTTDCIVADANADDLTIDGWTFRDGDGLGTQKQSQIQIAGATRPTLKNIQITGDFGTGAIENGTAWVDAYLENVNIDNASASPTVCVLLQATSTGTMKNCTFRVASGTTYLTANNDMQFFECYGTGTDATAGEQVGTQLAGSLEAKIDVIDGYFDVPTADAATDTTIRDVLGRKTDAAVYVPGTTKSISAYVKGTANLQDNLAVTGAAVMVDEDTLFTVAGGPILVDALWSVCVTANDATASTLAYKSVPTIGSAQTISGASASIANAAAGASVSLVGTAVSTAPSVSANGANVSMTAPIIVPAGTIKIDVGVGSTTGTWRHYLRYRPLAVGVTVS